jgi:hypothetical protein
MEPVPSPEAWRFILLDNVNGERLLILLKAPADQFNAAASQAQAILDMQLRRLAALERQRLADEYKQTLKLMKDLEALLGSPKKVLALIRENLTDLKTRYADPRRTQIADRAKAVLTAREHAVERDVWIAVDADGKLATQLRGGEEPSARASNMPPTMEAAWLRTSRLSSDRPASGAISWIVFPTGVFSSCDWSSFSEAGSCRASCPI